MLVPDASVLAHAVADGGEVGTQARALVSSDALAIPDVADVEVLSTLRRWNLMGHLADDRFAIAVEALPRLDVARVATLSMLGVVGRLRHNLTAYDACYVALASLLDATVVTRDARLARAPGLPCRVEVL